MNGCIFDNPNPQPNETARFVGSCKQGVAKGRLSWFKDGVINQIEEGEWVRGKLSGRVRQEFILAGGSFEGNFLEGKRTGSGIYRYKSGNVYEGNFIAGKRTGKGKFSWVNGATYVGDFIEGKRTGRGIFKYETGEIYEGDFVDGRPSGRGVLKFNDGGQLSGDFLGGRAHGFGSHTMPDGFNYTGTYENGLQHGQGIIKSPDGYRTEGVFIQGKLSGEAITTYPDGRKLPGIFDGEKFTPSLTAIDHQVCIDQGNSPFSLGYKSCRQRIESAKRNDEAERTEAHRRIQELQRDLEQNSRNAAIARGLSALSSSLTMLRPQQEDSSSMHIYNMPGRRSLTCTTTGAFTNCQ